MTLDGGIALDATNAESESENGSGSGETDSSYRSGVVSLENAYAVSLLSPRVPWILNGNVMRRQKRKGCAYA